MTFNIFSVVLIVLVVFLLIALVYVGLKKAALEASLLRIERENSALMAESVALNALRQEFAKLEGISLARDAAQGTEISSLRLKAEQLDTIRADYSALEADSAAKEKSYLDQLKLLKDAEANLKQHFENLANRIFDEKTTKFDEQSEKQLNTLLSPLANEIKEFRQAHVDTAKEIFSLKQLNELITTETNQLTRALRGDNKTQGDWGELVLERILESSGLSKGINYETQFSFNDDNNKRNRPDLVLFLPENKAIVLDSKVSLVAYERWANTEDKDLKKQAMKEHLLSIRRHIDGLAARNYDELPGMRNLDFVLLFIPIEAAFIDAVREDSGLYNYALDKNVALAAPSTLFATCKTVAHLQKLDNRSKNAENIAVAAGRLHDQFVLLYDEFDVVGKAITKASEAHSKAMGRIQTGNGNLLKKVDELRKMGAKAKKQLPADLLDDDNDDTPELSE
jgi:DNA recombination protein RmuC